MSGAGTAAAPTQDGRDLPVLVVGAGIAGVACARELAAAGIPVRLVDRGHRIGGRMATTRVEGRPVDVGASYLTARDEGFLTVVEDWVERGLARPWTSSFHLGSPEGLIGPKSGPLRYAAPLGLRSLVEDLAGDLPVAHPRDVAEVTPGHRGLPQVDEEPARAVVLAMPDPQALDLLAEGFAEERAVLEGHDWEPTMALFAAWDERCWPELDGVFVEDSPLVEFLADDGARRGDGAPVLVAHSAAAFAAGRLDDPQSALAPMLAEVQAVLGITAAPRWARVKRWSLARPRTSHPEAFLLSEHGIGLCGDGWNGRARVESAYVSGRALGRALAQRYAMPG